MPRNLNRAEPCREPLSEPCHEPGDGPADLPRVSPSPSAPCPPEQAGVGPSSPVLASQQLLQGRSVVAIAHNGTVYRLQATRQGKLILTK